MKKEIEFHDVSGIHSKPKHDLFKVIIFAKDKK